jgi:hypothetical protein
MPKMTHPDAKGSIEVSPEQVEIYESQGWEKQTASKSDK